MTVSESGAWALYSIPLRDGGLLSAKAGSTGGGINAILVVSALKCWTAFCIAQGLILHLAAIFQELFAYASHSTAHIQ